MIERKGPVRVIMNDEPGNEPGDFAHVRIETGLLTGYGGAHVEDGWELLGFGFVLATLRTSSYVDLVYRFRGAP